VSEVTMDYESDEYGRHLNKMLSLFLAKGLNKQAERLRKAIVERQRILAERKGLKKRVNSMSPIMKNYMDKVNKSAQIHTRLTNALLSMEDVELGLSLMNTFTQYVNARNEADTEFLTLVELRRMDDLEHLVSEDKKTGGK
jgi:hypothetical protein